MAGPDSSNAGRLVAKLERALALSGPERQALLDLPMQVLPLRADQDLVREGDRPSRCFLLLDGFACTLKPTAEGKRQILSLHVPGDMPDLQSFHLGTLDHTIGTLTPCLAGFIYHDDLRDLWSRHRRLQDAFWRMTLVDAAIAREWMVGLKRRHAYARVAHLFCELVVRLGVAGLAEDRTCRLPITQSEFADLLGLSTVHVNRTVQELRTAGLIALERGVFRALDWEGLKAAGGFDPAYLHLEPSTR